MADSNSKKITSTGKPPFTSDGSGHLLTGICRSRRVMIGVVLLLMLCGYFFVEDRPHPVGTGNTVTGGPPADIQISELIDDLELVDPVASHVQVNRDVSERPVGPLDENKNNPIVPPRPHDESLTQDSSPQSSLQQRIQDVHHSPQTSSQIAARPTLRFSGRIEPLR
ncbi:MAG: hypothetical protein MK102_18155 [Fuerstiella sp.]|nr:hypothetical protein [Fuerstiella sp.]